MSLADDRPADGLSPLPFNPEDRIAHLLEDVHRLRGRVDAAKDEKARIMQTVGLARARSEKKEDVEDVLETLERRFHEKSMGLLESMLSAFLCDVLPRDAANG